MKQREQIASKTLFRSGVLLEFIKKKYEEILKLLSELNRPAPEIHRRRTPGSTKETDPESAKGKFDRHKPSQSS